jgi:hypothetical protein
MNHATTQIIDQDVRQKIHNRMVDELNVFLNGEVPPPQLEGGAEQSYHIASTDQKNPVYLNEMVSNKYPDDPALLVWF